MHDDVDHSVFAFVRRARRIVRDRGLATSRRCRGWGYRLGVPEAGAYREIINTDNGVYGNGPVHSSETGWHGQPQSIMVDVPPLATVMWVID